MRLSKRQLRRIIRESYEAGNFREQIEYGDWPGRPANFEWRYVENEGPKDVRFDWSGGSMWYRGYGAGEVEGAIPRHLLKHLQNLGIEVYPE